MARVEEHFAVQATRRWIQTCVIDLNLCPFARAVKEALAFSVFEGGSLSALEARLRSELRLFAASDPAETATAFLLTPDALRSFEAYNDFQNVVDRLLGELDLLGHVQVATFHPSYLFAEHPPGDAAHFTNRSPYPMFHFLREADVSKAVEQVPDTHQIPLRNIELLQGLGREAMVERRARCLEK